MAPEMQCAMDLCLSLGCTLGELGSRMTSQEFGMWFHRWLTEPWGDRRADVHAGLLLTQIANWSGRTRLDKAPPFKVADFIPFRPREEPEMPEPAEFFRAMR